MGRTPQMAQQEAQEVQEMQECPKRATEETSIVQLWHIADVPGCRGKWKLGSLEV